MNNTSKEDQQQPSLENKALSEDKSSVEIKSDAEESEQGKEIFIIEYFKNIKKSIEEKIIEIGKKSYLENIIKSYPKKIVLSKMDAHLYVDTFSLINSGYEKLVLNALPEGIKTEEKITLHACQILISLIDKGYEKNILSMLPKEIDVTEEISYEFGWILTSLVEELNHREILSILPQEFDKINSGAGKVLESLFEVGYHKEIIKKVPKQNNEINSAVLHLLELFNDAGYEEEVFNILPKEINPTNPDKKVSPEFAEFLIYLIQTGSGEKVLDMFPEDISYKYINPNIKSVVEGLSNAGYGELSFTKN